MRLVASVALAGSLTVLSATAHAIVPRVSHRLAAQALTALPAAHVTKPLRTERQLRWSSRPSVAWTRLTSALGGTWNAAWDRGTGVPSRIWGSGLPAPGSIGSPAIAEQIARQLLADHLAALAPGASIADFTLVANSFDGDIRSVGFAQSSGGRRVVGGQVSFRFKRDRMFMIASEALPNVVVVGPSARVQAPIAYGRTVAALRRDLELPSAPVSAPDAEVILPLVADDAVLGYRIAMPVTIDGGADGRYLAYADPATGDILAVHQLNTYATGTVLYRGIDRNPMRPRPDRPAPFAQVLVDGAPATTAGDGTVSWGTDTVTTLTTAVTGTLVTVVNKASGGAAASAALQLAPNGQVIWDASAVVEDDAQVATYLSINKVKDYVARTIDANMPTLGDQITANVNIAQDCNAFFDGKAVNFFHATAMCQNTGLLEDVVFHEFGHALHAAEIIDGVGAFDGAMSEGAADFLAASITGDPGMGRGFFFGDLPLRDLDPIGNEATWPQDIGEIHTTGLIFGGTFWDLRKAFVGALGDPAGIALVQRLYVGALRRSINIPTSLLEVLATDDDDGNLANGTPHECAIREAYGRHGLRTATGTIDAPAALDVNALRVNVRVELTGLSDRCNVDDIDKVTLSWRPSYTGMPAAGSMIAAPDGPTSYGATLPLARNETVFYHSVITFTDGSRLTLPDNLADQDYQLYQGHVVALYCTNFDTDPFAEGWTTGTADNAPSPWTWGTPSTGATDPPSAFTGTNVLALGLGDDYAAKQMSWVKMPEIDVGQYTDVRLQYRRWLAVEDSHFDQARITTNDTQAWVNTTMNNGDSSALQHIDLEWRFHDVPLSGFFSGHKLVVGWDLKSDEGLELGGWTIDDVCVVANTASVCGDGIKSPTEQCDKGPDNADVADTCRTFCRTPICGDGIIDSMEECDSGGDTTKGCSPTCTIIPYPELGGCCSANGGSAGSLALGAVVGMLLVRPRRSRRRRSATDSAGDPDRVADAIEDLASSDPCTRGAGRQ